MLKQTVLMIDDDIDDINLTKAAFDSINADIKFSYLLNAKDIEFYLVQHSGESNIRLILLDLNMQPVNGKAILRHLKNDPNFRGIPIVVFSSSDAEKEREECLKLGANTFITKPANVNQWHSFVQALCFLYLKNCLSNQNT